MKIPVSITEKRLANLSLRGNQKYTTNIGPATAPVTPIALPNSSRMLGLLQEFSRWGVVRSSVQRIVLGDDPVSAAVVECYGEDFFCSCFIAPLCLVIQKSQRRPLFPIHDFPRGQRMLSL